jgi:hypothetical protein
MKQTAIIKTTGQEVTIADFSETRFWVQDSTGAPVENKDTGKYTHNISNGEYRFWEAQHEAQIERDDYLAAMAESNFE